MQQNCTEGIDKRVLKSYIKVLNNLVSKFYPLKTGFQLAREGERQRQSELYCLLFKSCALLTCFIDFRCGAEFSFIAIPTRGRVLQHSATFVLIVIRIARSTLKTIHSKYN